MHIHRGRAVRRTTVLATTALLGLGLSAAPAFAAGPATTVAPATGLDPAGQDIQVTGSGFDPDANSGFGVYVAFGPKNGADWYLNANAYQVTKWVHKNASSPTQVKMNADGTFEVTLSGIEAQYTDGDGNRVDCLVTQCYVLTFAAHGSPDRSQDTATPVTFTGGENPGDGGGEEPGEEPGEGGGGGADQRITANVTRTGALSMSVDGTDVTLSDAAPGGHATGDLNRATVTDARGTDAGWNLVGQMSDLTASGGGVIPAANLAWTPSATVVEDGSGAAVTAGPQVTGLGTAQTLATSAAGASGGVFTAGAALDLLIPAGVNPGSYTGTLTLTLS